MQALVERIRAEGRDLGGGILKVDSFINHQLDPALTMVMGRAFAQGFAQKSLRGISKVVTAEVSGLCYRLRSWRARRLRAQKAPPYHERRRV
jgi:xanthine phosphoribosyltransferase